jgi:hypothetical protein
MNSNSIFSYYSRGGYIYDETDEVYLKNGTIKHLAVDKVPLASEVKRWATFFPAMAVDIGAPDPKGHNHGERDFEWRKGKDVGGGPDIWRRDFKKAVVLHRPAYWDTTVRHYEGYSKEITLGETFYRLMADGRVGPGISSIVLRAGEGAILMKKPIVEQ